MINSRAISDLHPYVATLATLFVASCKSAGIDVILTSTHRDSESQNALYAIGRTVKGENVTAKKPMGDVVTNAKGGESIHNFRLAFDFCPIVNGKAQWNNTALFERCGKIAESVGLEWAGRWKSFREMAHCQATGGLTLSDLRAGKIPRFPV